ncbi:MAG: DUF4097 family beta strand repeat-containing protein [Terriglobia bacterium]
MIKAHLSSKGSLCLILLVAVAPAAALASGPFQRTATFYTTRAPRISVTNLTGTVIIRGWDRPQVDAIYGIASPHIEIDTEQVPSQGEAEKIQLATHLLDRSLQGANAKVDYTLDVPMGSSLEIRNPQGSVRIDSLSGDTWVQSVGGNIYISDASGQIIAHSLGGQIEIDRASGYIEASSVTGNLKFVSPTSSQIHASTTSGQISYQGKLVPAGDYVMSTYNGDIDFVCPPSSSFELNARSVHGKLDNQLKLVRRNHHPSVSSYGTALFGMHNQGTATLELTSFRGTIRITPQPQQ